MSTATASLDNASFQYISGLVLEKAAIVLDLNKAYLVESRLLPLARRHGLASIAELVAALRARRDAALCQEVIEAMTTHETSFFRDLNPFEALRLTVVPKLIAARAHSRILNIWCAACSSGQEPYTIALLLREHFPALAGWNVRLMATDLSAQILDRAREGIFTQTEVNRGLPAPLLVKYFKKIGLRWQLKDEVRRLVQFSEMNLITAWPAMPRMDIVFLRNVLIYFSGDTKRAILQKVARLLAPDGYLFLGGAETTLNLSDSFCRTADHKTSYYQLQQVPAGASKGMACDVAGMEAIRVR